MNNTNKIQVFQNEAFGQMRVIVKDGEPWFAGKDVAEALGYSDQKDAMLVTLRLLKQLGMDE